MIVTDPDGKLLYTNAAAHSICAFIGLESGEAASKHNVLDHPRETYEILNVDGTPVPEAQQPFMRAIRASRTTT